ncbi:hypothetical protein WG66_000568 [Moniliophthora roreri]|nr:hypothetical protein WG66_000568 [Moniliophthora roreri]
MIRMYERSIVVARIVLCRAGIPDTAIHQTVPYITARIARKPSHTPLNNIANTAMNGTNRISVDVDQLRLGWSTLAFVAAFATPRHTPSTASILS